MFRGSGCCFGASRCDFLWLSETGDVEQRAPREVCECCGHPHRSPVPGRTHRVALKGGHGMVGGEQVAPG